MATPTYAVVAEYSLMGAAWEVVAEGIWFPPERPMWAGKRAPPEPVLDSLLRMDPVSFGTEYVHEERLQYTDYRFTIRRI